MKDKDIKAFREKLKKAGLSTIALERKSRPPRGFLKKIEKEVKKRPKRSVTLYIDEEAYKYLRSQDNVSKFADRLLFKDMRKDQCNECTYNTVCNKTPVGCEFFMKIDSFK